MQVNAIPTSQSRLAKSTSKARRGRRRKLVFVVALTMLGVALVASVVLLTMIVVRRLQQQQQQRDDVTNDVTDDDISAKSDDVDLAPSRSRERTDDNGGRRRAKDDSIAVATPASWAVFRALRTASRSAADQPSPSTRAPGDERRRPRLPAGSRRRHANRRRHRGRPRDRLNDGEDGTVVRSSAALRRLARIALTRHLRTSDD